MEIGVSSSVLKYNHGKEAKLKKLIGLSIDEVQQKSTENITKCFKRVKATPAVQSIKKNGQTKIKNMNVP